MQSISLFCAEPARRETAQHLQERYQLVLLRQRPQQGYWLELGFERLELCTTNGHGAVYADFVDGAARHRRTHGGGRGQPVARAIGLKGSGPGPTVIDATVGLGRDAFVLASLGCQVTLIERSPIAAALLDDALERAARAPETANIAKRMTLVHADAISWLGQLSEASFPEVIHVDPMFPETGKSAAAKKDMQAFQQLIGDDLDSPALLAAALRAASKRVVVKRPRLGEIIPGPPPSAHLSGKSTRFDIYSIKALQSAGQRPANLAQDG